MSSRETTSNKPPQPDLSPVHYASPDAPLGNPYYEQYPGTEPPPEDADGGPESELLFPL